MKNAIKYLNNKLDSFVVQGVDDARTLAELKQLVVIAGAVADGPVWPQGDGVFADGGLDGLARTISDAGFYDNGPGGIDDDLGELDPSAACGFGEEGCGSCQ